MLAVNVKETENVKIEEDTWTRHKETVKEQNGLNRKQLVCTLGVRPYEVLIK